MQAETTPRDGQCGVEPMTLTGERTVPGIPVENYWYRRHEAAYLALARLIPPAGRVLEAGIGEGYGADLLADGARQVLGLDYDPQSVAHVRRRYPRIPVVRGNAVGLPFATDSFDTVLSLQLVEHLWDQPRHVAQCARTLRPGGTLVVSTPNRLTFSPGYDPATDRPRNLYHTRELAAAELSALLAPVPGRHTMYGLRAGPRLHALDRRSQQLYGAGLVEAQLARPAGQWPADLAAMVAQVRAEDFVLSSTDLDSSLDLLAVVTLA